MLKLLKTVISVCKQETSQSSQLRVRGSPTILHCLESCTCASSWARSGREARCSPLLPRDHTSRREVMLAHIPQSKVWPSMQHFLIKAGRFHGSWQRNLTIDWPQTSSSYDVSLSPAQKPTKQIRTSRKGTEHLVWYPQQRRFSPCHSKQSEHSSGEAPCSGDIDLWQADVKTNHSTW